MKTYKCGCIGEAFQFCKLHAAAPDLLEAAKCALEEHHKELAHFKLFNGCQSPACERLRAAIAKATGETK